MSEIDKPIEVYWKDAPPAACNTTSLHPAMLSEQGYRKLGVFKLAKGHARRLAAHSYCAITYDREFVIYWLGKKIIEKFNIETNEELSTIIDILKEAYEHHQQSNN